MATLMTDEVSNVFALPHLFIQLLMVTRFTSPLLWVFLLLFFGFFVQALCINSQFSRSSQFSEVTEHFTA